MRPHCPVFLIGLEDFSSLFLYLVPTQRLTVDVYVILLQDEGSVDSGNQRDPRDDQEGMTVTDVVPQFTKWCGEDDLPDLGSNLVADHVEGSGNLGIKVQGEVTEETQGEAGCFWSVQQFDEGNADWVGDQTTATDPDNHDGNSDQEGLADPDLLHHPWDTGHHDSFQEDFHGVQDPVHLLAKGLGGKELGEELWEHLLVEDGVEGPGEDDV